MNIFKKKLQVYTTLFFYSDAHEPIVIIEEAPSVENPPVEVPCTSHQLNSQLSHQAVCQIS